MIGLNGRTGALGAKETRLETTASVWKLEGGAGEKIEVIIGLNERSSVRGASEKVKVMIGLNGRSAALGAKGTRLATTAREK